MRGDAAQRIKALGLSLGILEELLDALEDVDVLVKDEASASKFNQTECHRSIQTI